jgi:hypothetical protein
MHRYLCYMHDMRRHTGTTLSPGRKQCQNRPRKRLLLAIVTGRYRCYSWIGYVLLLLP